MTQEKPVTALAQVCQGLQKMQPNFAQALPKNMSAERFVRTATNAIQTHPQKDKLLAADRQSLYNAILKSAQDGLEIDGREATLIAFNSKVKDADGKEKWVNNAQYIPMVQGLVKLARNSGLIASISSEVVYENDEFEFYEDYEGSKFNHRINWKGDRGAPILVWAKVKLTNGETIIRAFTRARIDKIAGKSKNGYQYDPDKGDYFEEWWRKAAIKNVLKYCPRTTELERAIEREEKAEFGIDEEIIIEQPTPEPKPARKTKVSEAVKEMAQPEPDDTDDAIDADYDEEIPV